ncbi:MAG: hypothetical protein K2O70_05980 [Desulfovibrionaceae bacterium]|nr:hypothetical protein [Desulfovibrionaceae bacterium]
MGGINFVITFGKNFLEKVSSKPLSKTFSGALRGGLAKPWPQQIMQKMHYQDNPLYPKV